MTPCHAATDLDPCPQSTRAARALLTAVLREAEGDALSDDAVLLVSEVVGNAVRHGAGSVHLEIECTTQVIHVEVADASPALPVRRAAPWHAEGGRGTALLDELASSWGVRAHEPGKVVWFELCCE